MRGNPHVRFLEGKAGVTPPTYSIKINNSIDNRTDLPTVYKDELVRFETGWHNSWRIYLHGKYELSPIRCVTPFVRVNIGYAFFSHKNERPYWDQEGNPIVVPFDVKGGISPSLDLGYSKRIGDSNIKLSGVFFILYQPINYNYASYNVKKDLFSLGAKIGVIF